MEAGTLSLVFPRRRGNGIRNLRRNLRRDLLRDLPCDLLRDLLHNLRRNLRRNRLCSFNASFSDPGFWGSQFLNSKFWTYHWSVNLLNSLRRPFQFLFQSWVSKCLQWQHCQRSVTTTSCRLQFEIDVRFNFSRWSVRQMLPTRGQDKMVGAAERSVASQTNLVFV